MKNDTLVSILNICKTSIRYSADKKHIAFKSFCHSKPKCFSYFVSFVLIVLTDLIYILYIFKVEKL